MTGKTIIDIPTNIGDAFYHLPMDKKLGLKIASCKALHEYLSKILQIQKESMYVFSKPDATIHILIAKDSTIHEFVVSGYVSYFNSIFSDYIAEKITEYFNINEDLLP